MFQKGDIVRFINDELGRYKKARFKILQKSVNQTHLVKCIKSDGFRANLTYYIYTKNLEKVNSLGPHHLLTNIFQ